MYSSTALTLCVTRPCGAMDSASDFGSESCGFESRQGLLFFFLQPATGGKGIFVSLVLLKNKQKKKKESTYGMYWDSNPKKKKEKEMEKKKRSP